MKERAIRIDGRLVGSNQPCFIVAEAGVNHNGSVHIAKKLVDAAKKAGADAIKFQVFKARDVVTDNVPLAAYQRKNIRGNLSQLRLLEKLELSGEDFCELKRYCGKKKIVFMATPHSREEVDLVARLSTAIKVGSGDLTNLPFLEHIAKKKLPIILSTGMSDIDEIEAAIETIKRYNDELVVMHCTTSYPASYDDVNLRAMSTLKERFGTLVGYSDHTLGLIVPMAAVAMGANVIEKHLTLDRRMRGPDHKASLEPKDFKEMVSSIRLVEKILGSKEKKPTKSEIEIARIVRKSIVAKVDIPAGAIITKDMLAIKRPGTGIEPGHLGSVVGQRAKLHIRKDQKITWEMIGWPKERSYTLRGQEQNTV